jgi:hypothetical protein
VRATPDLEIETLQGTNLDFAGDVSLRGNAFRAFDAPSAVRGKITFREPRHDITCGQKRSDRNAPKAPYHDNNFVDGANLALTWVKRRLDAGGIRSGA